MKHFRKSGGFTLVELVVSIAVASLVTMATTTVLMLALRVNRQTSDTASQQNTVRALLTTMEKAATDGSIKGLVSDLDSWQLIDQRIEPVGEGQAPFSEARVIFGFDSETQTIYTSGKIEADVDAETGKIVYVITEGIPVLYGVYASNVDVEDNIISLSVETREGVFESRVFLRAGSIGSDSEDKVEPEVSQNDKLNKFLAVLLSQYGSNGTITYTEDNPMVLGGPTYYSEWYIQQTYSNGAGQGGWNANTPWCACYVSWALVEAGMEDPTNRLDANGRKIQWYAHVDKFLAYLKQVEQWSDRSKVQQPNPGDLVFFDWITDDGVDDPQHMGVVLQVTKDEKGNDVIITIEGNSAGRVAMRSYPIGDPRILGYGVLSWS